MTVNQLEGRHVPNVCEKCGRKIKIESNGIWLEAQISPFRYRLVKIPGKNSQGFFYFHRGCAEKVLKVRK